MKHLSEVDFKAKLVQDGSSRNSKNIPVIWCVISACMKRNAFVLISNALYVCVN